MVKKAEKQLHTRRFVSRRQTFTLCILFALLIGLITNQPRAYAQRNRPTTPQPAEGQKPAADKVSVMVVEIKDSRTTGKFFAGMEVKVKILGDPLTDAIGTRFLLDTAIDNTGRNLIGEKTQESDFNEVESDENTAEIEIKLKNPVRQATTIQELSGSVELFIPDRDPNALATIANVSKSLGVPLNSPALKAAGIEIIIWNKGQFEARKKAEEARLKKEMEEKAKKADAASSEEASGEALAEGLMKMFGGLFNSFAQMDDDDIAFQIADPNRRLVKIAFETARGKPLHTGGRMSMGSDKNRTIIYSLEDPLPNTAQVKIYILTPKATIKTPFKLTNVPLP